MRSGEPCWLVVCSLRDVFREMVYDRAMREIFPRHCLRRYVEIPPHLCPRNMDMEYSYAIAPYRVESAGRVIEDYARRWLAFDLGNPDYPTLRAIGRYPARETYRGPHLRLWVVRRPVGILDTYGPRHPRLPCGRFVDYYHLHTLFPSGRSPAYEPLGSLAPSVSSSVAREEERAQGSPDDEADSPPPVVTSPSTPTTSVGGSPPGGSSPVDVPEALEPLERPRRRRRIGPPSLPSPTPPDSPEEAQSPSAPANNESAEGIADSSEGVVPSSSR
ncbi:hypothetical protein Emag_007600 [Eimeria magna]